MEGTIRKTISVIIPVYNAQASISRCLESLLKQQYSPCEIILVDNMSTDKSPEIVKQIAGNAGTQIIIIKEEKRGPSAARNRGAGIACGEILAFTDSDCILPEDWISKIESVFSAQARPDMVAGGATGFEKETALNKYTYLLRKKTERCRCGEQYYNENFFFNGPVFSTMNLAMPKAVFEAVGGFDESFIIAEDIEFCERAQQKKMRVKFISSIYVYHIECASAAGLFTRFFKYERGGARFYKKYYRGIWSIVVPKYGFHKIKAGIGTMSLGKLFIMSAFIFLIAVVSVAAWLNSVVILFILGSLSAAVRIFKIRTTNTDLEWRHWWEVPAVLYYTFVKQAGTICGKISGSLEEKIIYL